MRKIWDKLVALIYKVPFDKWLHFMAGLIIAAFFAIVIPKWAEWCIVPVFFAGCAKGFFDVWTTDEADWDWKDLLATLIGGFVIQLFVIL